MSRQISLFCIVIDELQAPRHVMQTRNNGKEGGHPVEGMEPQRLDRLRQTAGEKRQQNRGQLQGRRDLADEQRADFHGKRHDGENGDPEQNDEITADDDHREPSGNDVLD